MRVLICVALLALAAACSPPPAEKAETPPPVDAATATAGVTLDNLQDGARVASPLVVTGIAPKNWYFEAQFPAMLVGADGRVIAEAPAQAQSDWTAPGNEPIRFRAEFTFTVAQDTPATLVLQQDQPGEDNPPAPETRVSVTLAAH